MENGVLNIRKASSSSRIEGIPGARKRSSRPPAWLSLAVQLVSWATAATNRWVMRCVRVLA